MSEQLKEQINNLTTLLTIRNNKIMELEIQILQANTIIKQLKQKKEAKNAKR
tara:strand:+ start:97 stop:252 length:156 start_codon:yes stop_codon:yes gene_type:complete